MEGMIESGRGQIIGGVKRRGDGREMSLREKGEGRDDIKGGRKG